MSRCAILTPHACLRGDNASLRIIAARTTIGLQPIAHLSDACHRRNPSPSVKLFTDGDGRVFYRNHGRHGKLRWEDPSKEAHGRRAAPLIEPTVAPVLSNSNAQPERRRLSLTPCRSPFRAEAVYTLLIKPIWCSRWSFVPGTVFRAETGHMLRRGDASVPELDLRGLGMATRPRGFRAAQRPFAASDLPLLGG